MRFQGKTIRDAEGKVHHLNPGPVRAMALSPALTEMLFALLPDSCIIAVTSHCNHPLEKVRDKPVVSVMPLDFEKILSLRPGIIFTEEGITSEDDLHRLRALGIPVVSFRYRRVGDIVAAMDSVCNWTHAGSRGKRISDSLRKELAFFEKRASEPVRIRKRILALTWTDPIFAYGFDTWMSDKMRLAGGKNVLEKAESKPYPVLERERVLQLNPELIFGGSFGKMDSSFFHQYPELRQTNAYRTRQVFQLDDDLASRPGPRFPEAIREMEKFIRQR